MSKSIRSASTTKSKRRDKNCGACGKPIEGSHWARHFKLHNNTNPFEYQEGQQLTDTPWCSNWLQVINENAEPVEVQPKYNKGKRTDLISRAHSTVDINEQMMLPDLTGDDKVNYLFSQQLQAGNEEGKISPDTLLAKRFCVQDDNNQPEQPSKRYCSSRELFSQSDAGINSSAFQFAVPSQKNIFVPEHKNAQDINTELEQLNTSTVAKAVKVAQLWKILTRINELIVANYIEQNKQKLDGIVDLVLCMQTSCKDQSVERLTQLSYASLLLGENTWAGIPNMYSNLSEESLKRTLSQFSAVMGMYFDKFIASWFFENWQLIEAQTLRLMQYLICSQSMNNSSKHALTFSTAIRIDELEQFCAVVEHLETFPMLFALMSTTIKTTIQDNDNKLSFCQFNDLIQLMTEDNNQYIIQQKEDDLRELPLWKWKDNLDIWIKESTLVNVSSTQQRLNELVQLHGSLQPNSLSIDLQLDAKSLFKRHFLQVTNPPNALQFANAQYAACSTKKCSKQLWKIPSGQGKSRTLASIALILLTIFPDIKHVHLVYCYKSLMLRDQRDFDQWWKLQDLENRVAYHDNLTAKIPVTEPVLIDEADVFLYADPHHFSKFLQEHTCICVTATPHDDSKDATEKAILNTLGMSLFDGLTSHEAVSNKISLNQTVTSLEKVNLMPLKCAADDTLIQWLKTELPQRAVILYCDEGFRDLLSQNPIQFISIDKDNQIDDDSLRQLDKVADDNSHQLVVIVDELAMRGIDFRAPAKGLTLVIAKSFSNMRNLLQGVNRVGRFGDQCFRYLLEGIEQCNEKERLQYLSKLNKFAPKYRGLAWHGKKRPQQQQWQQQDLKTHKENAEIISRLPLSRIGQLNGKMQECLR